MSIKILHFGDTHGNHRKLEVPEDIDIAIFSGDAGTYRDAYMNEPIVRDFIDWYYGLDIPHKIMIAGNHDSAIESNLITKGDISRRNIIYLENEDVTIKGIKIWGSPYTPSFNNWSFNKARHKLHEIWDHIPKDTDILVTHGPPKGVLDLTENRDGSLEMCGCANLFRQVYQRVKPKYHLFGHIHNRYNAEYHNTGLLKIANCDTIFSNGSVCKDGQMSKTFNNGNIFNYE